MNENIKEIGANEENIIKPPKKYTKALCIIGIIIAVIIVASLLLAFIGRPYNKADNTYRDVYIASGATTSDIAETLKENGIIRSESSFKFISAVKLYDNKYKPGIYSLSASMNTTEIAHILINGIATDEGFTLPAGYTLSQTAEALERAGFGSKETFLQVASSGIFGNFDFLADIPAGADQLEGYLMPGQYEMSKDADEVQIIVTMLNQFDNSFTQEYRARAAELGYSIHQIVIIASIIETETNIDDERDEISAVIHNRLKAAMPPLSGWPDKPLCSPSIESIEAALYPAESSDLFYVLNSKLNGTHVFVETEAEYLQLKSEYNAAMDEKNKSEKED